MNQDPISETDQAPKPRVLVVDDDPAARGALASLAAAAGFEVDTAETSGEALERLTTAPPDLLLVDARMRDPEGFSLTARARRLDAALGLVVVTAPGAVRDGVEAMRAGADHYLTSPVDADQLAVVLGRVVEQRALRREAAALRESARQESRGEGAPADGAAREAAPVVPGARLEDIERHAILSTLAACEGSTHRAAGVLGVSVRMIQYRLREYRYGIRRDYGADHRNLNGAAEQGRRLDG